jgi:hypothetical protein
MRIRVLWLKHFVVADPDSFVVLCLATPMAETIVHFPEDSFVGTVGTVGTVDTVTKSIDSSSIWQVGICHGQRLLAK